MGVRGGDLYSVAEETRGVQRRRGSDPRNTEPSRTPVTDAVRDEGRVG